MVIQLLCVLPGFQVASFSSQESLKRVREITVFLRPKGKKEGKFALFRRRTSSKRSGSPGVSLTPVTGSEEVCFFQWGTKRHQAWLCGTIFSGVANIFHGAIKKSTFLLFFTQTTTKTEREKRSRCRSNGQTSRREDGEEMRGEFASTRRSAGERTFWRTKCLMIGSCTFLGMCDCWSYRTATHSLIR